VVLWCRIKHPTTIEKSYTSLHANTKTRRGYALIFSTRRGYEFLQEARRPKEKQMRNRDGLAKIQNCAPKTQNIEKLIQVLCK
jgi:hypothetical protein